MSLELSQGRVRVAIATNRKRVRRPKPISGDLLGRVAKQVWPQNTAAELASRSGVTVRAAEYWLAGHVRPNAACAAAIVSEIFGYR
jgi:hypothetical protein